MANREYFQGDQRQDSYEFVGRPNDPYSAGYGYDGAAPPARYEPGSGARPPAYGNASSSSSPPPAYGHNDSYGPGPYGQQQQQQQQQQYGRPQNYPSEHQQGRQQQPVGYGQQNPAYGQPPQHYSQGPAGGNGEGDERGFLGAVAGGAAGGFGGHKMGHGVLGAVGGAVAGSMLQDHFKKEKHEKEEQHRLHQLQQQQQQQQQHHGFFHHGGQAPPPQHRNFEGNFSASSAEISLDRDYDLIARCGDCGGGQRLTSINLNDCLTNEFGNFKWQRGGNFGGSARNVRLADHGRVLEAELGDGGGGWRHAFVYLDEKITNENGELRFLG